MCGWNKAEKNRKKKFHSTSRIYFIWYKDGRTFCFHFEWHPGNEFLVCDTKKNIVITVSKIIFDDIIKKKTKDNDHHHHYYSWCIYGDNNDAVVVVEWIYGRKLSFMFFFWFDLVCQSIFVFVFIFKNIQVIIIIIIQNRSRLTHSFKKETIKLIEQNISLVSFLNFHICF